jgi:hypothetical protein
MHETAAARAEMLHEIGKMTDGLKVDFCCSDRNAGDERSVGELLHEQQQIIQTT